MKTLEGIKKSPAEATARATSKEADQMPTVSSITDQRGENQRAALHYAKALGWRVFPVHSIHDGRCTCGRRCASPGKHPLTRRGLHDATTDPAAIRSRWQRWPWANIGIATGEESGMFVLDVDGATGRDSLQDLEAENGRLPDTVESLTGGGGRHILFRYPTFPVRNSTNHIAPGLDIRGDGGYIVAPRSLHVSGRRYEWEAMSRPDEVALAPAPEWLLNALFQVIEDNGQARAVSVDEWRGLGRGVAEGGRNNAIARVTGHLLRRYVNPSLTLQLVLAWNEAYCSPPLAASEVVRTVNSIARNELRRRQGGSNRGH